MPIFLQDNKMLAWILAALAFLVAFILILKIFEIVVDLRRRMPRGSRSRQQRLGFVETFDLDGERQLLLLRRDNVEHLVLIGGPNDVLVESGIVRAESREARNHRPAPEGTGLVLPPALVAAAATVNGQAASAPHLASPPAFAPIAPTFEPLQQVAESAPAAPQRDFEPPVFAAPPAPEPRSFEPTPEQPPHVEAPAPFEPAPHFEPPAHHAEAPAPQAVEPPPPVADRAGPRFPPLPPRVFQPRATPRQLPPLPPRNAPAEPAAKAPGSEPTPRPRFVMPPIARRATPLATNPPRPLQPDLAVPAAPEPVKPSVEHETPAPSEAAPPPMAPEPVAHEAPAPESSAPQAPLAESPAHEASKVETPVERPFDADFEPLESLEEEMAKLLGRPLSKN